MIYLAMWSCVTGALLILLSPCVSSQNVSSVATVSTSVTSTLKPTSEWLLNTSDALAPYRVKTVIKVPLSEDEQSVQFRREMETKLAGILNEALQRLASILSGTYKPLRRRRAVTVNNATVQVTNISRADPVETSHTTLVYYMIEGNTAGAITAADRTAGLMQLFSDQELAIKFGYEVVVKAEVYVKPPPAKEQKLWIIGAVIGGVAGLVILIWCFLFIYFKCTRPPKKIPSQRPPHPTKIVDVDQLDYKGRDVKGFDYARTEVGLESELDRQNVPEYYRRYPMGSTDLEGMYSPGETPPPPFRGHHPSSGSAKRGPKGEPPYPPPAPPSNGFIHPISSKENQAKSTKTEKKTRNDEACSTDQDTEDTQGSRRSEDRKPLSSKKGRLSHKHKHSGHHADQFEHVSKMGRVDDPEMLVPPTRTTIHAIKAPVLENRPDDDTLPEIPPEKDINETLQQKAEIERWRNKQRQRERSGQNKHQKARAKENAGRHHPKDHNNEKTPTGEQPSKPKRKKKKPQQKPVAKNIPAEDNIEMTPVYDHQVIQPVIASMPQAPCLPHLESDSSDDGLEPASSSRDRQLVSALLDEAFAMATPTPTINLPEEPKHPAPQLTLSSAAQQTPVYVTPASTQTGKTSTMWNPYEAADQAAYLVPPGQIVNSGSRSPSLRGGEQKHPRPSPHSTHQYTNPAYMADLPTTAGLQPIQSSDINDSSTPRYGTNPVNGFMPNSPRAFTPYKKPAWTDLTPSAWDDPDGTLPAEHRFGGRQSAGGAAGQPRSRPSDKSTGCPRTAKPTRHEDADDEIDIVTDVMKNGASSQSLIASIREEIERLAKRPQDNRTQQKPIT